MSKKASGKRRKAHEVALQTAATQIQEILETIDPATLRENLEGDVSRYAQLVNALTRLSEGALKHEKYRAEVAERKERIARELKAACDKGGLSPELFNWIENELKLF